MTKSASKLDIEKFRKIHAHATRNGNAGERDNARRMAEAMAAKAGMTFDEAVSKMDTQTTANQGRDFYGDAASAARAWADFAEKERQRKEREWADEMREQSRRNRERRYRENLSRRAEVLTRYRTIFDVFEPTARERALRKAVSSFSTFVPYQTPAGRRAHYTSKLDKCFGEVELGKLTRRARRAIENAYPMPETLADALAEVKEWDQLRSDRDAFDEDDWSHDMEVEARICLLEEMLHSAPARTWEDVEARFDWNTYDWSRQWLNPADHERDEDIFLSRLRADIAALRMAATPPMKSDQPDTPPHHEPGHRGTGAQSGHRTTAQKRADVLSMLDAHPELSSREIARRLGVSPQTVASLRKRAGERSAA